MEGEGLRLLANSEELKTSDVASHVMESDGISRYSAWKKY